jgi:hypothetical protein
MMIHSTLPVSAQPLKDPAQALSSTRCFIHPIESHLLGVIIVSLMTSHGIVVPLLFLLFCHVRFSMFRSVTE